MTSEPTADISTYGIRAASTPTGWITHFAETAPQRLRARGIRVLAAAAKVLLTGYVVTEDAKRWFRDKPFLQILDLLGRDSRRSADRKFFLRELLKLVAELPGDTAEAGVYEGASSWIICDFFGDSGKAPYAINSLKGCRRLRRPTVPAGERAPARGAARAIDEYMHARP